MPSVRNLWYKAVVQQTVVLLLLFGLPMTTSSNNPDLKRLESELKELEARTLKRETLQGASLSLSRPKVAAMLQNWNPPARIPEGYVPKDFEFVAQYIQQVRSHATTDNTRNMSICGNSGCLPDFFVMGPQKSGTADTCSRLKAHKAILMPTKEPHFWTRRIHWIRGYKLGEQSQRKNSGTQTSVLERYFGYYFRKAHRALAASQDFRVLDCSASNLWDIGTNVWTRCRKKDEEPTTATLTTQTGAPGANVAAATTCEELDDWKNLPPGFQEYLVPHLLHALLPSARFVLLVRDPIDRLYSDYYYFYKEHDIGRSSGRPSPESFHFDCLEKVQQLSDCFEEHSSFGLCLWTPSYRYYNDDACRVELSLYILFLRVWMESSGYSASQFHIRPTSPGDNSATKWKSLLEFLDITSTPDAVNKMLSFPQTLHSSSQHPPMLNKTRALLRDFFQPFNQALAAYLNNTEFLFAS